MHTPEEVREAQELLSAIAELETWLAGRAWPRDVALAAMTGACVKILVRVAQKQGGIERRMRLYTEGVALLVKEFYEAVS